VFRVACRTIDPEAAEAGEGASLRAAEQDAASRMLARLGVGVRP
jgi:dsRNA-specific ribonuclease